MRRLGVVWLGCPALTAVQADSNAHQYRLAAAWGLTHRSIKAFASAVSTQPAMARGVRPAPTTVQTQRTGATQTATNLALDQDLLDRAFRVSGEPTKKAAVTRALQEFIARRDQRRVAELFGKLEWAAAYNYKAERTRKP